MKIKCLAIDDEPLALQKISNYILKIPFLESIGECRSGFEAIELLSGQKADLLFEDIDMPGLNGLDLVSSLQEKPAIIFTTAFSEYAIEGFKLDALDFLIKPIGYSEFLKSAYKARSYFESITSDPNRNRDKEKNADDLFIKSEGKIIRISIHEITYIEGMREYVRIHLKTGKPLISLISLTFLQEQLPGDKFMRVHRSFIVNLDKVTVVENGKIILDHKDQIPISEGHKERFQNYLDSHSL